MAARARRDLRERMQEAKLTSWEEVGGEDLAVFRISRPDGEPFFDFRAGQYAQLAFWDQPDGDPRPRQLSIASAPYDRSELEFYVVLVRDGGPDGESLGYFTGTLWQHRRIGDSLLYMGPAGRFDLERTSEPDVICVATGTGLAPYVAMARQARSELERGILPERRLTVIHGVSYARELGYRDELEKLAEVPELGLTYIPTVSRPDSDPEFEPSLARGRANDILRLLLGCPPSGRVAPQLPDGIGDEISDRLGPGRSAFYLCGNPDMINDLKEALGPLGYQLSGRGAQVITEDYW